MSTVRFSNDRWQRIWAILKEQPGIYVGQERKTRMFVEAVLWMTRAGCAWRLLPAAHGDWNSVYKRFADWQEKGVWRALFDGLSRDADREWLMVDSTVVRAHACAAGAKKPKAINPLADRAVASRAKFMASPTASAIRCHSP